MILIADSGSTKTTWMVLENNRNIDNFQTNGFNPYYFKSHEIGHIIVNEFPLDFNYSAVEHVIYYGSGCSTDANCAIIRNAFIEIFPNAAFKIHTDLLAAVHALLGYSSGIACILGTGSNSCFFDGENIVQKIPSLGYLLGDEGSATAIGKKIISAVVYKDAPDDIIALFNETYNLTLAQILDSLYKKGKPGIFLSGFSKFVGTHIEHPYCRDLIADVFDEFIKNHICKYDDYQQYKVCFTGSVAFHFSEILKERLEMKGIHSGKILTSPAEGLIAYYTANSRID